MKIKSDTDLHVSTTWGASIFLKAGEEREVGDDLGYQALQQGAVEAKEAPKAAAPKKRGRPKGKAKPKEPKRQVEPSVVEPEAPPPPQPLDVNALLEPIFRAYMATNEIRDLFQGMAG